MKKIDNKSLAIEIAKEFGLSPYLTATQAAAFLSLSPEWLQLQRSKGLGPDYAQIGSSKNAPIRYNIIDLISYVEDHLVKTA